MPMRLRKTGQVFLRRMGVDTLVFTPDVINALTQLKILQGKAPSSNKTWSLLQTNLDNWHKETGYSLNKISQLLALSSD